MSSLETKAGVLIEAASGELTLASDERAILRRGTARARYTAGERPATLVVGGADVRVVVDGDRTLVRRADDRVEATWEIIAAPATQPGSPGGAFVRLIVRNTGADTVRLEALDVLRLDPAAGGVLDLGVPVGALSFYHHGWQSWSGVIARHLEGGADYPPPEDEVKHVPNPLRGHPETLVSAAVTVIGPRDPGTAIKQRDGKAPQPGAVERPAAGATTEGSPLRIDHDATTTAPSLLLGFVTSADQLCEVRLDASKAPGDGGSGRAVAGLDAVAHADGVPLAPGETLSSEVLWVTIGRDPVRLLADWAGELGRRMGARVAAEPQTGWCTWYYYFGGNSDQDVLDNLEMLNERDLPLDVVLIDDGYETEIGDWLSTNDKFPEGLAPVTQAIKAAGKTPGLWLAPFAAGETSRLAAEHPDWLLRDESGEPVVAWDHFLYGTVYALDCTRPEVLDWLRSLFRTLQDELGFEWFKLDFIYSGALAGRHYDPHATRAQAFRRGLQAIREAVGERFLLGCGAPQVPSVGLVDGMRIGPDVFWQWEPVWPGPERPSLVNALRNTINRSYMHGRLWANDPDCVLVRRRDDASELRLNEVRTFAAVAALSGGMALSSDNLMSLAPGRLKYLRQTLPPSDQAALPVDMFRHELPRTLILPIERTWGRWWVAGLINWTKKTTETTVELAEMGLDPDAVYHVFDFWSEQYLGVTHGRFTVRRHRPHETAILLFKPVSDRPELLASTFHVTQGAVEVAGCQVHPHDAADTALTLRVEMAKAGRQAGQVLFAVPEPWRVTGARVDGRPRDVRAAGPGVVAVGFELKEHAVVEVEGSRG